VGIRLVRPRRPDPHFEILDELVSAWRTVVEAALALRGVAADNAAVVREDPVAGVAVETLGVDAVALPGPETAVFAC
jgi:hypothetical protein